MQILFHIGAHGTGQDRLVRSLLKNRDTLARHGVAVPGPGRYRRVLGETLRKLEGASATAEAERTLIDTVLDTEGACRMILSDENFVCTASEALEGGHLYGRIGGSARLRDAFPGAQAEFALSLRNLATFLPALQEATDGAAMLPDGTDPRDLSWVNVVAGLRAANPDCPILVWCDEDTPLLWAEIMREIAGLDPTVELDGANDMARRLMSREGTERLGNYLERRPPKTELTRRKVVAAFLSKYAEDEAIEQEVALPGWTEGLIEDLTELYDEDLEEIAAMPGVTVLTP